MRSKVGHYDVVCELGRGGMGVVYRARQLSLDREVAIKFIASGLSDHYQVSRFLGEARAAARLVHPNIVPVHEVGSIDDIHYFSMALIEGQSLEQRLQERALTSAELLPLLLRVCEAVDYAHRLGLLHLDLKPANVLIDTRGEPLIADFGLARHMDGSGGVDAQEVSGTPAFMAPEQIVIKQYRLTAATDLYALGALLYRCLTGVSPHGDGGSDELIRRALAGRIRRVRELAPAVAPDLAAVCEKCLELEPRDRYASVRALIDDLRCIQAGLPVSVRRPGLMERAQRWLQREPKLAVAAAIAFAAIALGGAVALTQWRAAEAARAIAISERDAADAARGAERQQRRRAEDAAALGAWLFDSNRGTDLAKVAAQVVRWLRERAPGDEARQGEVLAGFAQAMSDGGSRPYVAEVLSAVMDEAGLEYRKRVAERLQARDGADALANAAMLVWRDTSDPQHAGRAAELLKRAVASAPDNVFAWYLASIYCDADAAARCALADASQQLVRVDGDNGFAWVLLAMRSEGEAAWTALHRAATSSGFHDYFGTSYASYAKAIESAGAEPPGLVAGVARALAPGASVTSTVAEYEAWAMPMPRFQRIIDLCQPEKLPAAHPQARADCQEIGQRMARAQGGLITNMIGSVIARRLGKGTPLEAEMKAVRARYLYLTDVYSALSHAELLGYGPERVREDSMQFGEMEAYARVAAHFGKPTTPPADWAPKDPQALLLPEERAR